MKEVLKYIFIAISTIITIGTFVEDCGEESAPDPINSKGYHNFGRLYESYTLKKETNECGRTPKLIETITVDWPNRTTNISVGYELINWICADSSVMITLKSGKQLETKNIPRTSNKGCYRGAKFGNHIKNAINQLATMRMESLKDVENAKFKYTVYAANADYSPFLEMETNEPWKGFNYLKWRISNCKK